MNSIDGALAYKATLDIDQFNVSSQAMERSIRRVSDTAVSESAEMEQSILNFAQNGAKYIVSYLVGQGMGSLLQSIISTRGQFQQLEIAFETMLGSGTKARALINQMAETAAKTPFDLQGVAGGAKQLLAYGESADKVNDTLVRLGNIASGLSIPLNDIVYLYGTTMVQGRLYAQDVRQFTGRGIPLVKELAAMYGVTAEEINGMVSEGKIGFPEVEKVIRKLTDQGGQFYNLMEKQSASLTGQIANLGDAWDMALNRLGEQNQDIFSTGISGATYLVEHLDDILRIVKAITIAYGSYKAAIILNTLATKGYTGVAFLDNTVRQAKIALMKTDAVLTGKAAAQTRAMTAAQEALGKVDLSAKSAVYRAALEQEVAAKTRNHAATLTAMRAEVSAAAAKVEAAKQTAVASMQATEAARYEVYWAKQSGDAHRIATAEKRLEGAQDNQAAARKAALAAQTDFYAKKKALETAATRQSTVASVADTAAKTAQGATTSVLTAITTRATVAMKALWASMMSNPIGWILGLVGALVSVLTLFSSSEEEATDAMGEFQETTKKEIDNLNLLFAILKNTEKGTKVHSDAVEKVNAICKEYNKTLLDENATLDIQKLKYQELTAAIQGTTAEKIKAKYVEQEMQKYVEASNDSYDQFIDRLENATYKTGEKRTITDRKHGETYEVDVYEDAENIQGMASEIKEVIRDMVESSVNQLALLSGDKYTEEYNKLVNSIVSSTKEATNATDAEMVGFENYLKSYLSGQINNVRSLNDAIATIDRNLEHFYNSDPTPVAENTDYVSMSFGELEQKIKDAQAEIDTINEKTVKVDADNTRLQELAMLIETIQGAIGVKTANLNTEAGISARIRELKEERSNVEINSDKYKELSRTIESLEAKMPNNRKGGGGGGNAAQNAENLRQKQLEAERKVEEARISIMEEGYEKRKAILDLQHKENLAQIDKEERDLIEARKRAGRGGLSQTEIDGFSERRNAENQGYVKAQANLFDGEIDYKKKQYELYFRWVRNMGQEVADAHFATLLKSGKSYKDYIEQQIMALTDDNGGGRIEDRQGRSDLSEGEANMLIGLKAQYNEIMGVKSAMDSFKDSITSSISQAATLADKLEAIARAKESLANGSSGLVGDEQAAGVLFVTEEEEKIQKEIAERIANDFKSYEEKKAEITREYNTLRLQEQVQSNAELLDRINQGELDALSALNAAQLKSSQEWKDLFGNLDVLTASEIERLISKIEQQMAAGNLELNPVDYQALIDSLNQARDRVVELNPFKAMGSALEKYIESTKKLKNAEKENLSPEQIKILEKEVKAAAKQMTASIQEINQMISSVGDSFSTLASSFGNDDLADTIGGVTDVLGGAGQTAMGVGQIMSGDLLGGITSCISGITGVIGAFNKMHDKRNEKRIQKMKDQIDALANSYDDLGDAIQRAYSTDKASMLEEQSKNLEKQNELIRKQIQEEKNKKDTDWDRIKDWEDQIRENEKTIAENAKYNIIEAIMGTEISSAIDELANAYADAWAKGEKAAGKSANVVKNLIKTAIIEQLKNKLKPEVEKFMSFLADAMEDGVISEAEERMLERYEKEMESMSDKYLSQNGKWLADDEDKEESQDPLTGAVRSMSEETGGVIAGRLNAFVINQTEQITIGRSQLTYQAEIAANTRASAERLAGIEETLKRIENNNGSSLLSQGIS